MFYKKKSIKIRLRSVSTVYQLNEEVLKVSDFLRYWVRIFTFVYGRMGDYFAYIVCGIMLDIICNNNTPNIC